MTAPGSTGSSRTSWSKAAILSPRIPTTLASAPGDPATRSNARLTSTLINTRLEPSRWRTPEKTPAGVSSSLPIHPNPTWTRAPPSSARLPKAWTWSTRSARTTSSRPFGSTELHLDFAVVADYALIDQQGKLSVLGMFQHVWLSNFPAVYPRTHLVLRVRGAPPEVGVQTIRIRFADGGGNGRLGGEGPVQFGEPPAGVVDVEAGAVLVSDVPLPRPGQYAFEISLDGEKASRVALSAGYPQTGEH